MDTLWSNNNNSICDDVKCFTLSFSYYRPLFWLELCTTYSSSSPVVTTTSIILCFNKHRLTQVHLENGCSNGKKENGERERERPQFSFSALTLLVGWQEGHLALALKNVAPPVTKGLLSGRPTEVLGLTRCDVQKRPVEHKLKVAVVVYEPYTLYVKSWNEVLVMIKLQPAPCGLFYCKNRPAPFPSWMSYKATKPGSVCPVSLSLDFLECLLCC